jgi:hypothetical protein
VGERAQIPSEVMGLLHPFNCWYFTSNGFQMKDFNEPDDDFLAIVSKGLIIFMMVLIAFLLEWAVQKI